MEPPSSVNNDQTMPAGKPADDPLSDCINSDTYLIVTRCPEEDQDGEYVVCGYSPRTGLSYIGRSGSIES
ncbi:MAG: hypothetical protein ACI3ZO_10345 [Candidatus Cryptobacteroides sp.]|nr:hypothetical protein [Bacteroidales bacterium]